MTLSMAFRNEFFALRAVFGMCGFIDYEIVYANNIRR